METANIINLIVIVMTDEQKKKEEEEDRICIQPWNIGLKGLKYKKR